MGFVQSSASATTTSQSLPVSLTTGSGSRLTTKQINIPSTTTTTTGSASSTTGGLAGNCAQLTQVVSSTSFVVTIIENWGSTFRMQVQMTMSEGVSNWMVQIIWPKEASNILISAVYNTGVLRCSANNPVAHVMLSPASWATTLRSGQQYFLEFVGTYSNMNTDSMKTNTVFKMFKQ